MLPPRLSPVFIAIFLSLSPVMAMDAFAEVVSKELTLPANRTVAHELITPATGIALSLGGDADISIQFKERGKWSPWQAVQIDDDTKPWEKDSKIIFTDDATAVRMRSNNNISTTLHAISVEKGFGSYEVAAAGRSLTAAPVIIPRWQWKANEDIRISPRGAANKDRAFYSTPDLVRRCDRRSYLYPEEFREKDRKFTEDMDGDGKEEYLLWPVGYSDHIDTIIVHHTAESSPRALSRSDSERMRTIYEYHAKARGWGDIGYNYVVGPNGTIFEGRAGGDYAVGAHAYCNNVGSMGISLMGNFQTGKPTDAQLTALRWLLVYLTDKYKIDPEGSVIFHGKKMPTIVGHRDVGQTACPGQYSQELLPQVRVSTNDRELHTPLFSSAAAPSSQNEAALMASLVPVSTPMGERKTVTVEFMNVGLDTWDKNTWLLAEGDDGVYFPYIRPFSFVAATMNEQSVPPGGTATFDVSLQGGLSPRRGVVKFTPVANNERRLIRNTTTLAFNTTEASPRFTHVTSYFPTLHKTGEDLTGTVKIINSGSVPWEQNTITELGFDLEGGSGEVTILENPKQVEPGKQASFRVRLQNVEEEGQYSRKLVPRFLEGSLLVGSEIEVASRAEPIPEIAYSSAHRAASNEPLPFRRGRSAKAGGAVIEALVGTELTLTPRGQTVVPIRIRTGKNGIQRLETIAQITRSNPTIVLRDQETNLRMRTTLRAPASMRPYQSHDMNLAIIAPNREGSFTFSIGGVGFTIIVQTHARATIKKEPSPQYSMRRRAISVLRDHRRTLRTERLSRRAPPPAPKTERSDIRIRLSYKKNSAILTSPGNLRIEGGGSIIFESGPVHLGIEQGQCKVSTANGSALSDAIRITPTDAKSFTTIMTESKSTNRFRGTLECRVIDGNMTLINELDIEDYLAGLAEEPDTEPWEKQRAFAIAARSYALFYTLSGQKKFKGKPYDGSDDPREFQAYGGVVFEERNPRWADAVRNTAGKVLTWERQIVKAPYFSSDNGKTNSAYDVWGWSHTPYLESKDDPWCRGMIQAGHGVGMSGCGSEGQANEGKTAEEILQYYYPGTKIFSLDKVYEWEQRLK